MTEKRFTKVSSDGYWKIKDSQADYKEIWDLTNPQLIEDRLNQLNDENEQLKKAYDDFKAYDDEDFREAKYINSIHKEEGFNGVIDYAKRRLCQYGLVKEIEDGLWVMVTGGWSDNEFWLDCLNSPVSMFYMKHYCAYERGGAFYYTEEPHKDVEIHIKQGSD